MKNTEVSMSEMVLANLKLIAFAVAVLISIFAIATSQQRFFCWCAFARLIASFVLSIFTTTLSGTIVKACAFVIILMYAAQVFKKIAKR